MPQIHRTIFIVLLCGLSHSVAALNVQKVAFHCFYYEGNIEETNAQFFYGTDDELYVQCVVDPQPACPVGTIPVNLDCRLEAGREGVGMQFFFQTADYLLRGFDTDIGLCSYVSKRKNISEYLEVLGDLTCLSD